MTHVSKFIEAPQDPEDLLQPSYAVVNPKTGALKEYPACMAPIAADAQRLDDRGAEIFTKGQLVNPLHKLPSIKSMVDAAERSGRLMQMHRQAQNLKLAEDDDPDFQGYDRNWLEENFVTEFEFEFMRERLPVSAPSQPAPDAPKEVPATTPADKADPPPASSNAD
ncbi:hypothetical protein [Apis mellifera associated microvirus 37]|nr:hypothetical protein [Apis mellifera associated microvirus 37]